MNSKYFEDLKLQQVPVLHVRGTHSQVGFAIGRTFKNLIDNVIKSYDFIDNLLIPNYKTPQGEKIYNTTLDICKKKFPGYVEELEGMAIGCNIPFYKLFLLHIETQIVPFENETFYTEKLEIGCSCVLSYLNKDTILMGHTEDARKALRNNVYIVEAEIINEVGEKLEKFSTLSYSCVLPGYTMGYNEHGLFHSMNSLVPSKISHVKTPIAFMMRALLGAKSLNNAVDILKDAGTGAADGFSVNFIYAPPGITPILQNIEIAPNLEGWESKLDIHPVSAGQIYAHCNKYIRMDVEQQMQRVVGSERRHEAIAKYTQPYDLKTIKEILSDKTHPIFPVFRGDSEAEVGPGIPSAATVAVGIFDIVNLEWLLYTCPPATSSPVAILPIRLIRSTNI